MAGQIQIASEGSFDASIRKAINQNFQTLFGAVISVGTVYFLDPANGSDANDGLSSTSARRTLSSAYGSCTAGKNDTVVLIEDGTTTATARVDAAFTWSKNATHLIGFCAPVYISQRARIAPTATTTAFANFFTVSASGCIFQNIQWFHGFNTGTTAAICMTVTGSRNYFARCHFAGMGDAASAQDAGSRSLKIGSGGSGENVFEDCTIGLDTVTRTVANASVEFAGATTRNTFRRCLFPFMTSSATVLGILGTGNGCIDRSQIFQDCVFDNAIKSTSTQMTVLGSFTTASPGGMVIFMHCASVGSTKFGDTNFLANSFIDMPATSASAGGLMLAPT